MAVTKSNTILAYINVCSCPCETPLCIAAVIVSAPTQQASVVLTKALATFL